MRRARTSWSSWSVTAHEDRAARESNGLQVHGPIAAARMLLLHQASEIRTGNYSRRGLDVSDAESEELVRMLRVSPFGHRHILMSGITPCESLCTATYPPSVDMLLLTSRHLFDKGRVLILSFSSKPAVLHSMRTRRKCIFSDRSTSKYYVQA